MTSHSPDRRIAYIDVARFYAMVLVFYGHFIERIMYLNNQVAASHYKFIYSFHLVLFIVLSGFAVGEGVHRIPFGRFVTSKILSRLLPFLFFTFLFMIPPAMVSGDFFGLKLPSVDGYLAGLVSSAFGFPKFNVPTWFLLLIFSIELIHYVAYRFLRGNWALLVGMVGFYVVGYWLNQQVDLFNPGKGRVIGYNYLFIHEAICMYAFFLLGVFLRKRKDWIENLSRNFLIPAIIVLLGITVVTYDMNQGPFDFYGSVVILMSSHGHIFWFPLTAISGSLLVILLAKLTTAPKSIIWLGRHTLTLMAMNGIFYHFVNGRIALWSVANLSGSAVSILGIGILITLVSLLLSAPLVLFFATYLPQLTGKPKANGPWLKALTR